MEPVRFEEKYRQAFIDFNTDWIVTYFGKLEPHDLETFERIDNELRNAVISLQTFILLPTPTG